VKWTLGKVFVLRHAGMPFDWIEQLGGDPQLEAATGDSSFHEVYWQAYERLERRLHELARLPLVQEAVFVSNPDMWHNVWRRYAAADAHSANAAARRVHRKAYTYLQRFCAKNETTSFFGPIGYGTFDPASSGVWLKRGNPPRRTVYFAHWAVGELARAIRRDRRILPALTVTAVEPNALNGTLTDGLAGRLLESGSATLGELAAGHGGLGAVVKDLAPLLREGTVELGPHYATGHADEFGQLRLAVAELGGGWPGHLDQLEALRVEYEQTGFPQRADVLTKLESRFTELTGRPARRGGGVYTDRLIVFEECASPYSVHLGGMAAQRLSDAVQEALEFSAAYGESVRRRHRDWVTRRWPHDVAELPLSAYAVSTDDSQGSRFDPYEPLVHGQRLPAPDAVPRYALPDICLAASNVDSLAAGGFDVIVARVHHHLLLDSWLAVHHPDRAAFAAPAAEWIRGHGEPAGLLGAAVSRRNKGFYIYPGEQVALGPRRVSQTPGAGPVFAADCLTVRREPDGPVLRDAGGRRRELYLPLADLTGYPPLAALSAPPVLHASLRPEAGTDIGEIRMGGAVYQRQRWVLRLPPPGRDPAARYLTLRRQAQELGLPRFVYVRTASERKPFLLDCLSPLAAELFWHRCQSGEEVRLESMRPGPDQLWLTDTEGRRYTCELRMQATTEGGAA